MCQHGGVVRGTCPNRIFKSWICSSTDWLLLKAHHTWWHSKWAPGLPLHAYTLWVCVCVCFRMCDYVVRISTSEDNVNESWLTLFPLAPSLFLSRGRQRKAKSCHPSHREVCRNKDSNSVCIFSTVSQKRSSRGSDLEFWCFYFCNLNVVQYFAVYTMKKGIKFNHWQKSAPLIPLSKYWFLQ